jgi:hypothetical protein
MLNQELSTPDKIRSLATDLNNYHSTKRFSRYTKMGRILKAHLTLMLGKPKPKMLTGRLTYKQKS